MKFSLRSFAVLAVLLASSLATINAEKITLATDVWLPFTGEAGSQTPGFMTEVAEIIFKAAGYEFGYLNQPWARAISNAENGSISGIIGCVTSEVPHFIFPKNELGIIQNTFYVLKDTSWVYEGIKSLENISIGAILDYSYSPEIDTYIDKKPKNVQIVAGDDALETNIKKLLAKRIEVTVEASLVFSYLIKKMGVDDKIKEAGRLPEKENLYIAFSPNGANSKKYAQILSDGIDALRKSGKLKEILNKYSLKDWK